MPSMQTIPYSRVIVIQTYRIFSFMFEAKKLASFHVRYDLFGLYDALSSALKTSNIPGFFVVYEVVLLKICNPLVPWMEEAGRCTLKLFQNQPNHSWNSLIYQCSLTRCTYTIFLQRGKPNSWTTQNRFERIIYRNNNVKYHTIGVLHSTNLCLYRCVLLVDRHNLI